MEEPKPRLIRLTAILTLLQSKRILTAREIAERYQISIRTVYRDIRALEQSGVPVITIEGKGYSIMEGYQLPPVSFTEDQASALITAEHLIAKNKDGSLVKHYHEAITKIKAVLRANQQEKAEMLERRIQIRDNKNKETTSHYLIQFQACIMNFQVVEITYQSLKEEETNRHIEPFALYTVNNNWILIAYCRMRRAFRAFRLDRIIHMQTTQTYFQPHQMTLEEYFEICQKNNSTPD